MDAHRVSVAGGICPQPLILVDGGGERTVLCRREEHMALQPEELERNWNVNARVLHLDGSAAATGWPLARQLDFSCAVAAKMCTSQGARGGIRSVAEIER